MEKNSNSIFQVKNILNYFNDMKHINVQHISLTNIPKQNDDYSCGVFVCVYSHCASLMINEDLSKHEWCDKFCSLSALYDIHDFKSIIHDFCVRLQYNENSTINKSRSSSSLLSIHEGIPPKVNQKQESSDMIEKSNDFSSKLNNDSSDNKSDFDESSLDESFSNSNNCSYSNDSSSEDIDFDVHSYQFKIASKHKKETHEYSCDLMIHHLLNDNDMYTHDPNIALNVENYEKRIVIIKYWK